MLCLALLLMGWSAEQAEAQFREDLGRYWEALPMDLSGSIGFSAEGYMAGGIESRRAPLLGETHANLGFNLMGLRTGLNLTYSTDQSNLRQSMNRMGFDTRWSWGRAAAGDVSPSFSDYALSGTTLRGGLLEVTPQLFHLAVAGGQSQRAIELDAEDAFQEAAFRQMLYAGRLGYGSEAGTHAFLVAVYGRDLMTSLEAFGEALPSENLVLSPEVGVSLLDDRLQVRSQASLSAFTRDVQADPAEVDGLPGFLEPFVTQTASSYVDYAGEVEARLRLERFSLDAEYQRVQPGFESLGVGRLRTDNERVRLRPQLNLWGRRLQLGGTFSHSTNNLLGQHSSTLRRMEVGANMQARLSERLVVSGQYLRLDNETDPLEGADDPAALHQKQLAHTLMLSPTLVLVQGEYQHTLALSSSYQFSDDKSLAVVEGQRPAINPSNRTGTLSYSLRFPSGFSLNATGNLLQSQATSMETNVRGLNLSTSTSLYDNALTLNLGGGWSQNASEVTPFGDEDGGEALETRATQLNGNAGAAFRLTQSDVVRLRVTALSNSIREGQGNDFQEMRATLRYQHRF